MPKRDIDLTEHYDSFIRSGISSGRYLDASETVRAALRLLEQQEREDEVRIEALRLTTQEAFAALDRGEGIVLSSEEDIDRYMDEIIARTRLRRDSVHA